MAGESVGGWLFYLLEFLLDRVAFDNAALSIKFIEVRDGREDM